MLSLGSPAGTYNPNEGAVDITSCLACAAGKANPVPGSSSPTVCKDCLPGSYSAADGAGECSLCAAGQWQGAAGQTACEECTSGYLCVEGSAAPQPCPGGTHADQAVIDAVGFLSSLDDDCVDCPAGFFCPVGSLEPRPCGLGEFCNAGVAFGTRCTPPYAPELTTTLDLGASSADDCVCLGGYAPAALAGEGTGAGTGASPCWRYGHLSPEKVIKACV